jgi:heme b synthase
MSSDIEGPKPRIIAWEITRSCNLYCSHCRASAKYGPYENELTTEECFSLIDGFLEVGRPLVILTGGEPLLREDFFDIAKYAVDKGLPVAIGSNGTLVTPEIARKIKEVPVSRLAVSLDFPQRDLQDEFRGKDGAFDAALRGIEEARRCGVDLQVNSTITTLNAKYLEDLLTLALEVGAAAFHPFLLVPTGRGKELKDHEVPAEEYERILNWIYDKQVELGDRMFFKPTDAPHYLRVMRQRRREVPAAGAHEGMSKGVMGPGGGPGSLSRGCMAGIGFCFLSHVGDVQGCGYLDVQVGNIREQSFRDIWYNAVPFQQLRDYSRIKGKCGRCEYKAVCGGCRARAYEATGDYLEEEPYCIYQPRKGGCAQSSCSEASVDPER